MSKESCKENDISFMDTEPMDKSLFDTEALDTSVLDTEHMTVETDEEDDDDDDQSSTQTGAGSTRSGYQNGGSDSDLAIESSSSNSDISDDENQRPPPPIDITMTPSHEVKRIYSDLIDSCRGFEDTLNNSNILKDNITTGDALFRQMEASLSQSLNETSDNDNKRKSRTMLGSTASELYLACQHTKVCSRMLKQAVKNVGVIACSFKLDEFLTSLRGAAVDQVGGYSVLAAVRKLAYTYSSASYSVRNFQTMFGCLEKDDLVKAVEPTAPKEAKPKVPRKKEEIKVEDATQKEVVNAKDQTQTDEAVSDTPEGLAKGIMKTLKAKCRQEALPQNMLEMTHADSVSDVVSRLFGVAFVVRDGLVGLGVQDENQQDQAAITTSLTLRPEKPPEKKASAKDEKRRNQYIASFSAAFLKSLVNAGRENEEAEVVGRKKTKI